jgi:hypothetical protein
MPPGGLAVVGLANHGRWRMKGKVVAVMACLGLAPYWGSAQEPSPERYPVRQLSKEMHQEGFPSWSPDGKTLVFSNVEQGHFGLFKVAAEGGTPVRFTDFIGEHPRWSRSSRVLRRGGASCAG